MFDLLDFDLRSVSVRGAREGTATARIGFALVGHFFN